MCNGTTKEPSPAAAWFATDSHLDRKSLLRASWQPKMRETTTSQMAQYAQMRGLKPGRWLQYHSCHLVWGYSQPQLMVWNTPLLLDPSHIKPNNYSLEKPTGGPETTDAPIWISLNKIRVLKYHRWLIMIIFMTIIIMQLMPINTNLTTIEIFQLEHIPSVSMSLLKAIQSLR